MILTIARHCKRSQGRHLAKPAATYPDWLQASRDRHGHGRYHAFAMTEGGASTYSL